jgi:hypothetical protein
MIKRIKNNIDELSNKHFFMKIKDKILISEELCCPPHYIPHKIPIGEKISDEPCHIHEAGWRMSHHVIFCKIIKCKNCGFMLSKEIEWKSIKKLKTVLKNKEKNK